MTYTFKRKLTSFAVILVTILLSGCSKEKKRTLELISNPKSNGVYDVKVFDYYSLVSDIEDDIKRTYDEEGKLIEEVDPFVSCAKISYSDDCKHAYVKVTDLAEYEGEVIWDYDFEFGDAKNVKATINKYDKENDRTIRMYTMFELDDKGRKLYKGDYNDEVLASYSEYYWNDDTANVYNYDEKGNMTSYIVKNQIDGLVTVCKYNSDNELISSDEKEYYESGILKRHTRKIGTENETSFYAENGKIVKVESYYENGNLVYDKEYDENGYLVKSSNYEVDGILEFTVDYENDEYGMPVKIISNSRNEEEATVKKFNNSYELNEAGKPVKIEVYDESSNLVETYTYEYDKDGNITNSLYYKGE